MDKPQAVAAAAAGCAAAYLAWRCTRPAMVMPAGDDSKAAWGVVTRLRGRLRTRMEEFERGAVAAGDVRGFESVRWLRNGGRNGGGERFSVPEDTVAFNRCSLNCSAVHYADKPLQAAIAVSSIIHPRNPHAPSMHIHVSWTEIRGKRGVWRVMADLNPSIPCEKDKVEFAEALKVASGRLYAEGSAQGDKYFNIPALGRTRGVTHFYLESYSSDSPAEDMRMAEAVGIAAIDTYARIITGQAEQHPEPSPVDLRKQVEYHSLYLFQVLTLDRGTTSGILAHSDNDVGIMGSLPRFVDRELIKSWKGNCPAEAQALVDGIADALPQGPPVVMVDTPTKVKLVAAIRKFYGENPKALDLQAKGNIVPPTVQNHVGKK
eukprot:TRINITY_DN32008_c0_g1_i1.p1 TRINITY_DN32008_c0_g1~~TRINITY_DN32008_c0_g1_i1.p1  ORF type:complete len:399 (+),score=138.97 TRINITY_DN32008_c0_g1_i1:72-1199(+)